MKYNTEDIYFGVLVCNTYKDGFYFTGTEPFIKEGENLYRKMRSKNKLVVTPFSSDTQDYMTVANLYPIVNMMDKDKIPTKISESKINLYLLKHKLLSSKQEKEISDRTK